MFLICVALDIYLLVLIARILLSWFPVAPGGTMERVNEVLYRVTEPVLGPVRRVLPPVRLGGAALDLSPIVVFLGINVLAAFLC